MARNVEGVDRRIPTITKMRHGAGAVPLARFFFANYMHKRLTLVHIFSFANFVKYIS